MHRMLQSCFCQLLAVAYMATVAMAATVSGKCSSIQPQTSVDDHTKLWLAAMASMR